jgi:Protein of unknown function (DUF3606)
MPDDLTKKRPQDSSKVNINEPYEVNYWTDRFKISKAKLIEAVKEVGPMVANIEVWLKSN